MDIKEKKERNSNAMTRHPWETARAKFIERLLEQELKDYNCSNTTLIDIGCGDLYVLNTMDRKFGFYRVIGVDTAFDDKISKLLIEETANNKIKLYNNINELSINNEKTIILLMDVIEHIKDDHTFLYDLISSDFVNEQTTFIITVPSYQKLFSSHDTTMNHYRRYSNKMLIKTLKQNNYHIKESGYFFSILLLPRIIRVLKEKISDKGRQKETVVSTWNKGKFITITIKKLFQFDFYIVNAFRKININIPGLSNYVICKKHV
jgi:trans-aconitate methyltransferase